MAEYVYLQCNKVGKRLRINIISPGYHHKANCMFPKAIRIEGRRYKVPQHAISVSYSTKGYVFIALIKHSFK